MCKIRENHRRTIESHRASARRQKISRERAGASLDGTRFNEPVSRVKPRRARARAREISVRFQILARRSRDRRSREHVRARRSRGATRSANRNSGRDNTQAPTARSRRGDLTANDQANGRRFRLTWG